jgi:hypothetical protein
MSTNGPPPLIELLSLVIIPCVMLGYSPIGLARARTNCPAFRWHESPISIGFRGKASFLLLFVSIFRTAISE